MQRYIAFLRAINVGGHTVKMERLRELFAALRFANVTTFIASGNVVFESRDRDVEALERRIERQLERALGYDVATFLRSPEEVAAIAERQPFAGTAAAAAHTIAVGFLKSALDAERRRTLVALGNEREAFDAHAREFYWARPRMDESVVPAKLLETTLGGPTTMRNVTTVRRLAAKYCT